MKLSNQEVSFFKENGYLLLQEFFSPSEIDKLNQELPKIIANKESKCIKEKTGAIRTIFAPEQNNALFEKLTKLPKLVSPMEQLLKDKVYLHQSKLNIKAALLGEWWQWHQDYLYWKREDGMPTSNAISIAIYLDDVTELNGPMLLLPGTHHSIIHTDLNHSTQIDDMEESTLSSNLKYIINKKILQKLIEEKGNIIKAVAPKGSILLFHGNTLHASNANLSPYDRKIMFLTYNATTNSLKNIPNPRPTYIANRDFTPIEAVLDEVL